MSFGRQFTSLASCENEAGIFYFVPVQIVLKNGSAEGVDFFESVGVNKDFSGPVPVFPEHLEQLVGGASIKISFKAQMQIFTVSVNQNSEIAGHGSPPVSCSSSRLYFLCMPNLWRLRQGK
jgi:hypothetical protein